MGQAGVITDHLRPRASEFLAPGCEEFSFFGPIVTGSLGRKQEFALRGGRLCGKDAAVRYSRVISLDGRKTILKKWPPAAKVLGGKGRYFS